MTPRLQELEAKHARSKIDLDEPAYTLELAGEILGYKQALEDLKPVLEAAHNIATFNDHPPICRTCNMNVQALRDALAGLEE